jgi:zinc protease
MRLWFGDEKSLQDRAAQAEMARGMLMRGTATRTRQQIRDELDRLKARVNVTGDVNHVEVTFETVRDSVEGVGSLISEFLQQPSFPAEEFEQLRQETLARYEALRREPQMMALNAFQRHLSPYPPGDPRYVATPDERIAQIKSLPLDEVRQFYRDFYGVARTEIVLAGDFDPTGMDRRLGIWSDRWKSARPFADLPRPYQKISAAQQQLEAPDKANAWFVAGLRLPITDEDADYPALVLANYMLGGHAKARLYDRIRGKEGLSYGVGSQLQASQDPSALWMAYAIANPANVAKVEQAFREEMERAVKSGFAAAEVEESKKGWLQAQQVSRSQDGELARRLRNHAHYGRTMEFEAALEKKVAALSPDQIHAAVRKHLDPSRMSIIKAGDFQRAAAPR